MEKKVSVVIPNYNGIKLLAKNLPNVVKNCQSFEIIIVDDGSNDRSVEYVQEKFKKIKIFALGKNVGFAQAVNRGVEEAKGDLVLLLNSDVSPQSNFLNAALAYFKNNFSNQPIFAVGLADRSHEQDKIIVRGKGAANFTRGFVNHYATKPTKGETLWVSGGSGLFDRQKFLELGGFGPIFAPFYWEDIDLSFRAWKKGYKCLFEPNAKVDHFHEEGSIKMSKSPFFIKIVSYKNQFLFVWKNISDPLWLVQHILWFPYHLAKSLLTLDFAFLAGFFWAVLKLPIFDYSQSTTYYPLSDREVLSKFAK